MPLNVLTCLFGQSTTGCVLAMLMHRAFNLQNEDETDIGYVLTSRLSWESDIAWNDDLLRIFASQIIPFFLKEIDRENSDNIEIPNNSKSSAAKHAGYTIAMTVGLKF